jgi:hypothetical protein
MQCARADGPADLTLSRWAASHAGAPSRRGFRVMGWRAGARGEILSEVEGWQRCTRWTRQDLNLHLRTEISVSARRVPYTTGPKL